MHLLRCAGLLQQLPDIVDINQDALGPLDVSDTDACLVDTAESFLRGGGLVSLHEWSDLSSIERAALTVAGDRIMREAAALYGLAGRSDLGAAEVYAPVDGGLARDRMALAMSVATAAAKLQGQSV